MTLEWTGEQTWNEHGEPEGTARSEVVWCAAETIRTGDDPTAWGSAYSRTGGATLTMRYDPRFVTPPADLRATVRGVTRQVLDVADADGRRRFLILRLGE